MSATERPVLLESGDHLTREEFHRRYCERPDIRKAELIGGVVYVASPTRYGVHGEQRWLVAQWLSGYTLERENVRGAFDVCVYLTPDSEVQPDAMLFLVPAPPGGASVRPDQYIEGAPQLVVEIAASSASYDLHGKLKAYEQAGVQNYVVWRVYDDAIDWFQLYEDKYRRIEPDDRGVIESVAFPGLRLHVAKLLAGDIRGVLAELAPPTGTGT